MINSIIVTALGLAIGTATSSSIMQPPAILHQTIIPHDIFIAHNELLRRVLVAGNPLVRRIQDESNCSGTPFLWKITEDATGNHVGFGVGTMHLPADIVTTDEAYDSIISAIGDSCDVYGELNLYDNSTLNEIVQCQNSTLEGEATLADIPDEGLREEVKAKILETILQYVEIDSDTAETLASSFDPVPLSKLYRFITFANTPEYMEKYAYNLIFGEGSSFLDLEILALGRPAGALEEVSTQCSLIQAMALSAEMLDQAFALDPDGTSSIIRNSLNASFSPLLQPYKCGDIDEITDAFSMEEPSELDGLLLTSRNQQMAAKVDEILTAAESDKKTLFAVGLAHWLVGSDNMISLLEGYGYSMEHIPIWNATQLDNPSNQDCGVVYNSETGLFVEVGSIGTETSDTVPITASTTPTKMPSQGAEKEAVPEPVASASCPMIGIATITMMIVWSSYMLGVDF